MQAYKPAFSSYIKCLAVLCLGVAPGLAQADSSPPQNPGCPAYNPALVINAARYFTSGISIASAHRGYWEYVPENSPAAFNAAIANCVEMTEMDVRLTQDSVPVPVHDYYIQRSTTGEGDINNIPFSEWKTLFLRDRHGFGTSIPAPQLSDLLDILKNGNNTVLAVDCKDRADGSQPTSYVTFLAALRYIYLYEQANNLPIGTITSKIIFKGRIAELPYGAPGTSPSDQAAAQINATAPGELPYVSFLPIWYAEDVCDSANYVGFCKYPLFTPAVRDQWLNFVSSNSWLWEPEIFTTYPGDVLQAYFPPPLARYNLSAFSPANDWPEGTSFGTGQCCSVRNLVDSVTPRGTPPAIGNFSKFNGDYEFGFAQGYNWFTSDKVLELQNYLQARGQRQTCRISGDGTCPN